MCKLLLAIRARDCCIKAAHSLLTEWNRHVVRQVCHAFVSHDVCRLSHF